MLLVSVFLICLVLWDNLLPFGGPIRPLGAWGSKEVVHRQGAVLGGPRLLDEIGVDFHPGEEG